MGHDITTLSNHNLNTKSLKALALDLFARLEVNIEYGFYGHKEYNHLLNTNYKNETIILDTLKKGTKYKTFRLLDDKYQQKELVAKYGKAVIKNPIYWLLDEHSPNCLNTTTTNKEVTQELEEMNYPEAEPNVIKLRF